MYNDDRNREKKFHLWGWLLFLVCAGFFIASAVAAGDSLSLIGSIVFFAGCVVFIVPLVIKGKSR
jgi:hypothetical protein